MDRVGGYYLGRAWLAAGEGDARLCPFHDVGAGGDPPIGGDEEAGAQGVPFSVGDADDTGVWLIHWVTYSTISGRNSPRLCLCLPPGLGADDPAGWMCFLRRLAQDKGQIDLE